MWGDVRFWATRGQSLHCTHRREGASPQPSLRKSGAQGYEGRALLRRLRVDFAGHLADGAGELFGGLRAGHGVFLREHERRHARDALSEASCAWPEISATSSSVARRLRTSSASRPISAAACTSTLTSVRSPPSRKYNSIRRCFISADLPCASAQWIRRWQSMVLGWRFTSSGR